MFIFDTISERSEVISTNGRVNSPLAAKGTCPSAGNWIHTQLPIPDCGPDVLWREALGGQSQAHPHPCLKCLDRRHPNLNPFRGSCPLRLKSSLLLLAPRSFMMLGLVSLIHSLSPSPGSMSGTDQTFSAYLLAERMGSLAPDYLSNTISCFPLPIVSTEFLSVPRIQCALFFLLCTFCRLSLINSTPPVGLSRCLLFREAFPEPVPLGTPI